jgi:DNA-binding response OmpR family regulator
MITKNGATRLHALVAADAPETADSLCMQLRHWGHDCDVAYGGDAALRACRERGYRVVIAEVALPRSAGFDLAEKISRAPGPRPLLIAVTRLTSPEYRRRANECGFDHCLVKPDDSGELRRLLDRAGSG